jgi:hypothetical protein
VGEVPAVLTRERLLIETWNEAIEQAALICEDEATLQELLCGDPGFTEEEKDRAVTRCRAASELRDDIRAIKRPV